MQRSRLPRSKVYNRRGILGDKRSLADNDRVRHRRWFGVGGPRLVAYTAPKRLSISEGSIEWFLTGESWASFIVNDARWAYLYSAWLIRFVWGECLLHSRRWAVGARTNTRTCVEIWWGRVTWRLEARRVCLKTGRFARDAAVRFRLEACRLTLQPWLLKRGRLAWKRRRLAWEGWWKILKGWLIKWAGRLAGQRRTGEWGWMLVLEGWWLTLEVCPEWST